MEFAFSIRDDGQVDAAIVGSHPVFNDALDDAISSLPPRGAMGLGPSTYWIDVARDGARASHAASSNTPFTWGNVTLLRVVGEQIEARYDYDDDATDGDVIPIDDFLVLLNEWAVLVRDSASSSTTALPETYRRNPSVPPA